MNRAVSVACGLGMALLIGSGPTRAQDAPAAPPPAPPQESATGSQQKYSPTELETLVGPIALYPDMVLAAMLPATAAALDVVQAARYVESKGGKVDSVPEDVTWDPAVVSLLQFPDVLKWMNENLEWVEQMAFAVSVQQSDVLAAIQAFRKKTQAAGNLKSDQYMKVETEEAPLPPGETAVEGESSDVIIIEPADPQVVYIPTYEPAAVVTPYYGAYPPAPLYGWGLGFAMGAAGAWIGHELGWWGGGHGGDINIDNNWNRNTNINRGDRPGRGEGPNRPQQWKSNRPAQRPGGPARGPDRPLGGSGGVRPAPGGGQGLKPPSRPPGTGAPPGGGAGGRPSGGARPTPAPALGGSRGSASTRPAGGGAFGGAGGSRASAGNSRSRGGQSMGSGSRASSGSRPSTSSRPSGGGSARSSAPRSGGGYNRGSFGGSSRSGSSTRSASSRGRSSGGGRGGGRGGGGRRR